MGVRIINESPNVIKIEKAYSIQKVIGIFTLTILILGLVCFILYQPGRLGKSFTHKTFNITVMILLLLYLARAFYFVYIDRTITFYHYGEKFKVNNREFLHAEIDSLLIIEYTSIGIMPNTFNLFIKLKKNKRIPVSINIAKEDVERIKPGLHLFFNIDKSEEKKRWWPA